jgi:hypothetical protein
MSEKSIWQRLLDIDHRLLASLVFIILTIIMLNPISVPFPISTYGQQYYDFVEEIPSGTLVGFMLADTPSTRPQLEPATVITIATLWEKDCPILFWNNRELSEPIYYDYIDMAKDMVDREIVYGTDYVYLGYVAGLETGAAAFLADMRQTVAGVDRDGNSLDDFTTLPIMEGVNDGFALEYGFFNVACSVEEPMWVRQWQMPYGTQVGSINCAMDLSAITQYLATGQIRATANGLLGSAEMEYLTGNLGLAFGQTLAVSFGGLYFTCLVILGNLFFFLERSRGGSG